VIASLKRAMLRLCMRRMAMHKPSAIPARIRNIAVWQFGGVGDMLLATPVIRALHEAYPEADIEIWSSTPSFADFLLHLPKVVMTRAFPVYDFDMRTLLRRPVRRALKAQLATMRASLPDLLVNLHVPAMLDWWAVEWWLIRRLAPAFSLGFDPVFTGKRSVFDVSLSAEERVGIHYTRFYRQLLEKAGMACGEQTVFPLTDEERKTATVLLAESESQTKRKVCMHIGARRLKLEGKMWPLERFAALAGQLQAKGLRPVLVGVESEREMAGKLCEQVGTCVNLVGRTSLGEMAALISLCDGFIGHDSGPFHVAVAVGTPCVAICGRPDAEPEYLDYGRDDVAVLTADTPEGITVEAVLSRALGLFDHG
jgi:ADP-heptose:LPS heptosyltransferase